MTSQPFDSMIHPTLVVAFPGLGQGLVQEALRAWEQRLGNRQLALEVVLEPRATEAALKKLLSQERFLKLQGLGYALDPALNLVVFAEASHAELDNFLQETSRNLRSGPRKGLEVRLHLVLFVGSADDLEALKHLPPDPSHEPATRLWPVSRWSRSGLRLAQERHLTPWVQHFVEALLLSQAPLHPENGRDWVGLGIARLEKEKPSPAALAAIIFQWVQKVQLNAPSTIPPAPSCAWTPPAPPQSSPRTSCDQHPQWSGSVWEEQRKKSGEKAEEALDQLLISLEGPYPYEIGRQALLHGLPALKGAIADMGRALEELEAREKELLEKLDQAADIPGKRGRLQRLLTRQKRGLDLQDEIARLKQVLEPVNQALEEGDLEFFLKTDAEAKALREKLDEIYQKFEENRHRWENDLVPSPQPQDAWWKRLLGRKKQAPQGQTLLRKRLCDAAWDLLKQAEEIQQSYTQRHHTLLGLWQELVLLRTHREALARERERALKVQKDILAYKPPAVGQEDNPLIIRMPYHLRTDHPVLQREAELLVKEGALEAFWDQDQEAFGQALWARAQKAARALQGQVQWKAGEEVWFMAVAAAAPRVLVGNWPEHRQYAYVLGKALQDRWGEAYDQEEWFPNETVLLRLLYPLAYPHFLEEEAEEGLPEQENEKPTGPGAEPPISSEVVRDNPLLDELLGL